MIFDFSRSRGLQEQDAAEVMQESLLQIAKSIQDFEYQPERGRFRGWVGSIVRSKLIEFHRKQSRQPKLQDATLDNISASTDGAWNEVWLDHVVEAALSRVEIRLASQTWTAFRLVWLEHVDPSQVAIRLGRDVAWVYLAKSRGLRLLREEVSFLADEPFDSVDTRASDQHALPDHAGTTE
jgi:RNA polymerase sigma-70 factor (ECF subfamily)